MNNTPRYLIYASLVSLAFAVLGGLWLVWHTIEEGRALERQNRELQASLEASRIRVENFCEYPSDVLCRVDERSGTVAGALPGNIPGLDELVGSPASHEEKAKLPAPADISSAKALENIQKVALAQSEVEAKASKATSVAEETPAPAAQPETEKAQPEAKNVKAEEPIVPAPVVSVVEAAKAAPEATPAPTKVEPVAEAPLPQKEENKAADTEAKPEEKRETVVEPTTPAAEAIAAPAVAPTYTQEFSGKLSDIVPEEPASASKAQEKAAATDNKKEVKPSAPKQATEKRMSWSRVEQDGDIFVFTITGAGESLKASGKLRPSPWRYELELDGLFDVRQHTGISNRLVKGMKIQSRNGKTVIVFSLKAKPYKSTLHQIDARTLSVRIR